MVGNWSMHWTTSCCEDGVWAASGRIRAFSVTSDPIGVDILSQTVRNVCWRLGRLPTEVSLRLIRRGPVARQLILSEDGILGDHQRRAGRRH